MNKVTVLLFRRQNNFSRMWFKKEQRVTFGMLYGQMYCVLVIIANQSSFFNSNCTFDSIVDFVKAIKRYFFSLKSFCSFSYHKLLLVEK